MYKPNFCAECGARILRARWRMWTSRRFCKACEPRFRRRQLLATLFAALTLFAIGLATGRALRPAPPPLIVQRGELTPVPLVTAPTAELSSTAPENQAAKNDAVDSSSAATQPEPEYGADGTATERPTDPNETISICGARTQKGTPCKRRVRGTGRCWQHRAMLTISPNKSRELRGLKK